MKKFYLVSILLFTFFLLGCNQADLSTSTNSTNQLPKVVNTKLVDLAKKWLNDNTSTFGFDGSNLRLTGLKQVDNCKDCWRMSFAFESSHSGFGDRGKKKVEQVITPHSIVFDVVDNKVTSAVTDEKFDELKQKTLEEIKAESLMNVNVNNSNGNGNENVNLNK